MISDVYTRPKRRPHMHRRHVTIHEQCHHLALSCAAGVQYIIDTVVEQCQMNPDRKFTYVEQAFFHRWWTEQTASTKKAVRALVKSGQLQFINGGWSMHDEACTHYVSMIENTAFGHRFLKDEFDYKPTVGWQIDPFGHSATQVICSDLVSLKDAARKTWTAYGLVLCDHAGGFVVGRSGV